jgi:hypothetical protein
MFHSFTVRLTYCRTVFFAALTGGYRAGLQAPAAFASHTLAMETRLFFYQRFS